MLYNKTLEVNHDTCYQGIFLASITGLAILLNISVILSLLTNLKTLPPYMLLVLNLAVSDISFAIVGFSIRAPGMYYHNFYSQNRATVFLCKSTMFFYLPILISINLTILLLTYDRKCAIKTPLHRGLLRTKRRVYKAVAMSWFISLSVWSLLVASVVMGLAGDLFDSRFGRCSLTSTDGGRILHFCTYFFLLMVPSFFTLFLYGQIVHTLLGYKNNVRSRRTFSRQNSRVFVQQELRHVGSKIKTKSFLTITIILVFYYLTLLPSFVLRDLPMILSLILGRKIMNLPPAVTVFTSVAFYLSTLTDPIVYGIRSPHIFKTVKQMMWFISKDDVSEFDSRMTCSDLGSSFRSRFTADVCPAPHSSIRRLKTSRETVGESSRTIVCSTLRKGGTGRFQIQQRQDQAHVGQIFNLLLPVLVKVRRTRMQLARWKSL